MVFDRVLMFDGGLDFVPRSLGKFSLMVNVQKLFGLLRIQIQAVAANKLQRIPLRRIVTSSDSHSSVGLEPGHGQLQAGCRTNSKVDYLATRGQQSGHYG